MSSLLLGIPLRESTYIKQQSVYCKLPLPVCSSTGKRSYNTSFRRLMAMFLAPLTSRSMFILHLEQVKTSFPFTGVSLPQTPHVCEVYSSVQISRVHFVSKHFAFNLSLNKKCFSCNKSRFIPLIFLLFDISWLSKLGKMI